MYCSCTWRALGVTLIAMLALYCRHREVPFAYAVPVWTIKISWMWCRFKVRMSKYSKVCVGIPEYSDTLLSRPSVLQSCCR